MNNNQTGGPSSTWSLILGAVAGLGTLVAAIAPLTVASSYISELFINPSLAGLLSILSLITITLMGSFYASKLGFMYVAFEKVAPNTRRFFLGALISIVTFLAIKLAFDGGLINMQWGALLQAISYLASFGLLGSGLGLFLRDMYQRQQYDRTEKAKLGLLRNLFLEAGHLTVDFKIYKMQQNWNDNSGTYMVEYESYDKRYVALVDRDFRQIIDFEEKEQGQDPR